MAEGVLEHIADIMNVFAKAAPSNKFDMQMFDSLHKGGWENLDAQIKSGAAGAEIEMSDASSDIADMKSKSAIALARARLQRHQQFKNDVKPTILRMMRKSANSKVICTAFALAGLHMTLALNKDFDLAPVIDCILIGAGTYFGYEVIRDFKHKGPKHTDLAATDLDTMVEGIGKLDRKATKKLASLVALNIYDSEPLAQAEVFSAIGLIATGVTYGLIYTPCTSRVGEEG